MSSFFWRIFKPFFDNRRIFATGMAVGVVSVCVCLKIFEKKKDELFKSGVKCSSPGAVLISTSAAASVKKGVVARKTKSGKPLCGVIKDIANVHDVFIRNGIHIKYMFANVGKARRREVIEAITLLLNEGRSISILYYTGHGARGSGAWCFRDNQYIRFCDIQQLWESRKNKKKNQTLYIISDSCFSGVWVEKAIKCKDGIVVQASCESSKSCSDGDYGGNFTYLWVKGMQPSGLSGYGNLFTALPNLAWSQVGDPGCSPCHSHRYVNLRVTKDKEIILKMHDTYADLYLNSKLGISF